MASNSWKLRNAYVLSMFDHQTVLTGKLVRELTSKSKGRHDKLKCLGKEQNDLLRVDLVCGELGVRVNE